MMNEKSDDKKQIIQDYLSSYQTTPSLTLAKALCRDHPDLFSNIEGTRFQIRYYRGASGEKDRDRKSKIYASPNNLSPFQYTEEDQEIKVLDIPIGNTRLGYISDVHIPHECFQTNKMAFNDWRDNKVNVIILNGDLLDNPTFGKHPFDPSWKSKTKTWMDQAELYLENLREMFPDALIYFTEGNHDFWYRRFLWTQAQQLSTDPYYSLEERLHLMEYKINFVPQNYLIRMADYYICHGHLIAKGGMLDTVAKRMIKKVNSNCIIGHMHYASSFTEYDIIGNKAFTCHVSGCGSTVNPSYMPFGGKARKGYINAEVLNGKLEVENVWNDNGKKKIITI